MTDTFLTPLAEKDAPLFLEAVRRSASLHRGWVEPPTTQEAFELYLKPAQQNCLRFAVSNAERELVGIANINAIIRGTFQNGCLGFFAFEPHQRRGFMRSALTQLVTLAFSMQGLHRLEANIQPSNTRSCALIEGLGFRCEALSPRFLRIGGVWQDHRRYALTAEEWRPDEDGCPFACGSGSSRNIGSCP